MTPRRQTSSNRDRALAITPVVLIAALAIWSAELFGRADEGRAWVRHSEAVLANSASAFSHMQDAETGQRGFLMTGDAAYLQPFQTGRDSVAIELSRLKTLTSGNERQQLVLNHLGPVAARRLQELDSTIVRRRRGDAIGALALMREGRGKQLMDSARVLFAELRKEERRLLEERTAQEQTGQETLKLALLLGVVGSAAVSYFVVAKFSRQAARQAQVSEELAKRNHTLQEQALEIETANQQMQDQQVELEAANEQLREQQVELELSTDQMREHGDELALTSEKLRQANDAKGKFLANMSHELRTPLNAIAGHVQLIEMGLHGPVTNEQRGALDRIARAQRHLLVLINDILNFTKLEAGRVSYVLAPVDVGLAMKDVTAMVEPQMSAAGLSFTSSPGNEKYMVMADAEKLRQVLINLFSNATKFTPMGGRVSFGVAPHETDERLIELRVSDTGIGIPADKLETIFDPFVQLAPADVPTSQGVGLGLAISRDLAHGMGGELTVWSREELGSTFTLTLRRVPAA
ncbi:MAG: CHASE3 domain-containing protein [Gemmatimonadaceae bacterium]